MPDEKFLKHRKVIKQPAPTSLDKLYAVGDAWAKELGVAREDLKLSSEWVGEGALACAIFTFDFEQRQ